ncbi:MAG: zinc-binding dehydrogenase [Bacteroidetes bacterium]|nr:zinc-binding dehydrogenase [Bacteroidota bacterium]
MKGIVLKALHQPVEYLDLEIPKLETKTEVLVKISYASLNHRDVWIQKGLYAGIKLPAILGSDCCGEVVEVSQESDKHLLNNKVIINSGLNWGDKESHQAKDFIILGMPTNGTLAEYVKVDSKLVYMKPEHMTDAQASCLPLAGLTAYRALFTQGQVQSGQKVLITGIGGGVAHWAMQFALANKNEVWVTSGDDLKIKASKQLGVKGGVNYKSTDWWKQLLTESGEFDVIIDGACGDGFNRLIDLCKSAGKIVIYGGTAGSITNLNPAKVFWKQLSIIGSTMGSDKDFENMVKFVNENKVLPNVEKIYELKDTEEALRDMELGKQFGKIIIKVEV